MRSSSEPNLATLNHEIARLETHVAELQTAHRTAAKSMRRAARRRTYLRCARRFRAPAASIQQWPLIVFAIGPLSVGVLVFVLSNLVLNSWPLAVAGFVFGSLAGAGLFAALLYRPENALFASAMHEAEANYKREQDILQYVHGELTAGTQQLAALEKQRRALSTGDKLQRAMLLQRNWKAMRDAEWEDYVVEVCRTLGANVQRIQGIEYAGPRPALAPTVARALARATDQTLIVTFSPRRVAVAAPTGIRPFHTAAVQQLINGLATQGCDAAAIITNTRLTAGGKELATARTCTLIGEDEFPDFVMGKITL